MAGKLSDDRRRVCLSMPRDLLDEIDEMRGQVSMTRSEYVSGTLRDAMRGRRELADEVRESLARIEHGLDGAAQKLDSLASRVGYVPHMRENGRERDYERDYGRRR